MVAVFYCFLNGEVRLAIKSHLNRWNEWRSVGASKTARSSLATTQLQVNGGGELVGLQTSSSNHDSNCNENAWNKEPLQQRNGKEAIDCHTPMLNSVAVTSVSDKLSIDANHKMM